MSKQMIEVLEGIRKGLTNLHNDSKTKMCDSTQNRRHVTIFVRESYLSLSSVILKNVKESNIASISFFLSVQNYLITAYFLSTTETEDFSDFYELMDRNMKDLQQKIKDYESKPKIVKVS